MADPADLANDEADLHLRVALANRPRHTGPVPRGRCHNCLEPLPPGRPFCDGDCRDDWEARHRR